MPTILLAALRTDGGHHMTWKIDRAWRCGLLTALVAALVFGACGATYLHYQKASKQKIVRGLAASFAMRIAQRTHEAIAPAYILAALIRQSQGHLPEFNQLAADLLQEFPLAHALELAPAGVVRQVYPLRGNEAIVGHDLLKDRTRNKEAHMAVIKRQLMIAGPFELIQGGLGAVARYPVFTQEAQGKPAFWGFVIALIHIDELLSNAGEMELERKGLNYRICKLPSEAEPQAGACVEPARVGRGAIVDPLMVTIGLPNAQWQLSVAPEPGWISVGEWLVVFMFTISGALLAGLTSFTLLRRTEKIGNDLSVSASSEC